MFKVEESGGERWRMGYAAVLVTADRHREVHFIKAGTGRCRFCKGWSRGGL
jgi:hypothetical protein